jgi:hypothetical protein
LAAPLPTKHGVNEHVNVLNPVALWAYGFADLYHREEGSMLKRVVAEHALEVPAAIAVRTRVGEPFWHAPPPT